MARAAIMSFSLPRLHLCLKWFIVACAAFIVASNVLYFGLDIRTLPRTLPRRLNTAVAASFSSAAASMPGKELVQEAVDWEALVDKVAGNQSQLGAAMVKALLLCQDQDQTCPALVQKGGCRPKELRLDLPMQQCRSSCGVCKGLARTLSLQLEFPVELVSEPAAMQGACRDRLQGPGGQCGAWAAAGLCSTKPKRMLQSCRATCHFCSPAPASDLSCQDALDLCPYLSNVLDLCFSPQHWWMPLLCARSCQECRPDPAAGAPKLPVKLLSDLSTLRPSRECVDYSEMCGVWKEQYHCQNDPQYMQAMCGRSCNLCSNRYVNGAAVAPPLPVGPVLLGLDSSQALARRAFTAPVTTCMDDTPACDAWAKSSQCSSNAAYMAVACRKSCGLCAAGAKYIQQPLTQVLLNNGVLMPTVGFGTAGLGDGTQAAVEQALKAGYRHLDSAQAYEWYRESAVGAALMASGVPRSEVFITTKVHPKNLGFNATMNAFRKSLEELGTEYVDLLLLHYPRCFEGLPGCPGADAAATWQDSWRALEALAAGGGARAIGVSNFSPEELQQLLAAAAAPPQVVQVRVDPFAQDTLLLSLCSGQGIQVEAYSALGTQWPRVVLPGTTEMVNPILAAPKLLGLASALRRSPAQVVLRWALQLGLVVLPRSSDPGRVRENLDVFGFELSPADMEVMAALRGGR